MLLINTTITFYTKFLVFLEIIILYCYVLEWSLLSDATISNGRPIRSATQQCELVTLAAVHRYYARNSVHVERCFL
jgi:hypothetical protein